MTRKRLMVKIILIFSICLAVSIIIFLVNSDKGTKFQTYKLPDGTLSITMVTNVDGDTLVIPDLIDGKAVTQINGGAFLNHDFSSVKSVVLPNYVSELQVNTFDAFENLEEVTIGNAMKTFYPPAFTGTKLKTVNLRDDNNNFFFMEGCLMSETAHGELQLFFGDHIPDGTVYINDYAFYGSDISELKLPDTVNTIGTFAFAYCDNLEEITIPGSVFSLGEGAFYYCNNLETVTIQNGVQHIKEGAFMYCDSLENVIVPESVTKIDMRAFAYSGLKDIPELGGVTVIKPYVFERCTNFVDITVPEGILMVSQGAFMDSYNLESVKFSSTVRIIETLELFDYSPKLNKLSVEEDNLNFYSEDNKIIDRYTGNVILEIDR